MNPTNCNPGASVLLVLSCLCASQGVAADVQPPGPPPVDDMLRGTVTAYVKPGYDALHAAAGTLQASLQEACADASASADVGADAGADHRADNAAVTDGQVPAQFTSVVEAWARMEWFRQGPVMSGNRSERFWFFPDRRGIGARQVDQVLAEASPAVTSAETLSSQSVALQGLGALERVLFDPDKPTLAGSHRCDYAVAIATNLEQIAGELATVWRGELATTFQQPGMDNPYFRTDAEALTTLLGTVIHGLEAVRDTRIAPFLRDSRDSDRPKAAPLWRSGNTLRSIRADYEGLYALYTASELQHALPESERWLDERVRFEFAQLVRTAERFGDDLEAILDDDEQRERLVYLDYATRQLVTLLDSDYSAAAGLAAGFSFGDGD